VVRLARRDWLVSAGDQLGDATVTAVTEQGVYVRRGASPRARPQLLRFAAPGARAPSNGPANRPQGQQPALGPLRVPLPPEPPAPSAP
jgi:hypothetical protein